MKRLATAIALFSLLLLVLAWTSSDTNRLSLAIVGGLLAASVWRSEGRSRFLNILAIRRRVPWALVVYVIAA